MCALSLCCLVVVVCPSPSNELIFYCQPVLCATGDELSLSDRAFRQLDHWLHKVCVCLLCFCFVFVCLLADCGV